MSNWAEINKKLRAPWPENLVKTVNKGGGKGRKYLDARDLMAALDDIVGPENWSTKCEVVDTTQCVVKVTLTIMGVSRDDFGYPNNPAKESPKAEHYKESATDGLKRAAVLFGIGREFYVDVTAHKWDTSANDIKDEAKAALHTVAQLRDVKELVVLKEAVKHENITSPLASLTADDYAKVLDYCAKELSIPREKTSEKTSDIKSDEEIMAISEGLSEAEQKKLEAALKPASELDSPDAQNEAKTNRYGDNLPPSTLDRPSLVRTATAMIIKRSQKGKVRDGKALWPYGNGKMEDIDAMRSYLAKHYGESSSNPSEWSTETLAAIDLAERGDGMGDRVETATNHAA